MKGQSLIEVLIALGTAVIVLAAIVSSVINALSNAQFAKNQNLATQYAQEGMETVRKMRDSDWRAFFDLSDETPNLNFSYCLDEGATVLNADARKFEGNAGCKSVSSTKGGQNVKDVFARQVDIEKDSPDCAIPTPTGPAGLMGIVEHTIKVVVTVSWTDGKCTDANNLYCHKSKLSSCFSDFNIIPTP